MTLIENGKSDLNFSGYPIEVYYCEKTEDYYIKCKQVYVKYKYFLLWKKDIRASNIGYNKKGESCKIKIVNNLVRIGCLSEDENSFNNLVKSIFNLIKWHKTQKQKK